MKGEQVRVRIAPSPTGHCHVGTARNALYNYIFAKQHGGKFVLRIEDTDVKRSTKEAEEGIYEGLRWLGLEWDEGPDVGGPRGPYRQTERLELYQRHAEELLARGNAYYCYCTPQELALERKAMQVRGLPPKYSGRCQELTEEEQKAFLSEGRIPAIRFRVPQKMVSLRDLVRGEIEEDASLYGDFIILRSADTPVYNFAVVVDDHLMQISHVFRSAEHISNTFRQILLYEALDFELPKFAHFPLLLNPDRSKISKRFGAVYIGEFREQGYLKEALLNFIALLGWNPGTDQEIFSLDELLEVFSLERISSSDAIFDRGKLDWMNGLYIRKMSLPELTRRVVPFLEKAKLVDLSSDRETKLSYLEEAVSLEQERMKHVNEAPELLDFFLLEDLQYDLELFVSKKRTRREILEMLKSVRARLSEVNLWTEEALEGVLRGLCEELNWKAGELFMPVRIAVTGKTATPPLFATMRVLGKGRSLKRIKKATSLLEASLAPKEEV